MIHFKTSPILLQTAHYLGVLCPPFAVDLVTESGLLERGVRLPVFFPFADPTDRAAEAAVPVNNQW